MTTHKFITRMIIRLSIYVMITIIALNLLHNPIITNELAMTQMENSNEMYILMDTVNKTKHYISIVYGCITALVAGTTINDIYKLTKTKEKM